MKEIRWSALNWAIVALIAIVAFYGIVSIFGTMPALTAGGYPVSVGSKMEGVIMPCVGSQWWLVFVPLFTFTVTYFSRLLKRNPKGSLEFASIGIFLGVLLGGAIGIVIGSAIGTIAGTIAGTIFGTIVGTFTGTFAGTILGMTFGTTVGTVQFLIYAVFLTNHHMEWLIALPGITITVAITTAMLISVLPFFIAIVERLTTTTFWESWRDLVRKNITG